MPTDLELGIMRDGYPALASWISRDPDFESFIFRRFSRLSARNLLNLQSRLISIESRIDSLDCESRRDLDPALKRWETFVEDSKQDDNQNAKERLLLYADLEATMQKYQDALLRQAEIAKLHSPRQRSLDVFRDWFQGSRKDPDPIIVGQASSLLDEEQDLATLKPLSDTDLLSRYLQDHWPFRGDHPEPTNSTRYVHEKHIVWTVAVISTVMATLLLVIAVVCLSVVQNRSKQLGLIAAFTALFAACVLFMTNARRAELFAATAAYTAILVVFISGNSVNNRTAS